MSIKSAVLAGALLAPLLLVACEPGRSRMAYGDVNRIIVVTPDELWAEIGDSVLTALEPRIFTVRDERTFELTHVSPDDPNYAALRQFRQVLVIGAADHSWVEPVVGAPAPQAPAIVERQDVWARGQLVTALVVPPERPVGGTLEQLGALWEHFDGRYRDFVRQRMFVSRPDTVLRDSLARHAGFSMLLPMLYRLEDREGARVFRTTAEMGAELIRTLTVISRAGVAATDAAATLAWRDSLAAALYVPPHTTLRQRYEAQQLDGGVIQVQGSWSALDEGWPFGGPFIARQIPCPAQERTYLVDAWVFAPGRSKYEYMIQLETLLDTFRCAP